MSNNNFLSSGIDSLAAVTDGSLGLFGSTIGATNLISGFPVKVNASQQLYATNLSTSDVTGLSANLSTLNNKTQNIDAGGTSSGITQFNGTIIGPSYTEGVILSMPEVASIPAVPAGYGYLWSDTSNDLHFKTSAGDAVLGGTGVAFLPLAGGTMAGDIDMNGWNIRHIFTITDSATNTLKGARNLLCNNSLTMTAGNLPAYVGTTDGYVQDSGVVASSVVAGPASAVSGNVAIYNGITGKLIQDSGASLSQYLPLVGGTMSGAIAMGANGVTGTGTNTAASYSASGTTDSSSVSTGSLVTAGGLGVAKKAFIGSDVVIGPTQAIAVENLLTIRGPSQSVNGPHMVMYVADDQYPILQIYNYAHDNTFITIDGYFDGTNWRASHALSNFQLEKNSNRFQFNYSPGATPGSIITWTNAGYIDTSGILQWQKQIKTADTTASSSISTGSIVAAGGIGIAGNAYIGGNVSISGIIDSASALNLGTSAATSVNIGKTGVITNITGSPPSLGKFSTTSNNNLTGVTTVQNLLTSGVGSLAYAANSTYTGTIIRYRFTGVTSNTSPNTQTVILAVNGTSAISIVWAPGSVTNAPFTITGILAIRASGGYADMFIDTNTTGTTLTQQVNATLPAWDKTAINTLSASIQYSNASSSGTVYHSMFETMFD